MPFVRTSRAPQRALRCAHRCALLCAFALTVTLAATNARAEDSPPASEVADGHTDAAAADAAAADAAPTDDGAAPTGHALRAEFGAALVRIRETHALIAQQMGTSPGYEAHDALLEGMIRLQRGDRMAWLPDACAQIAEGVTQFYATRGANRSAMAGAQLEATSVLQLATMCDTPALGRLAMQGVSYALPDMRNRGTEQRLAAALSTFAMDGERDALAEVGVPYLIPYFEALLTVADAAGLERVATARAARLTTPDPHVERYLSLAQSAPTPRVKVNAPEGCAVTVDGEPVRGSTAEVRVGWHAVGCVGGATYRFTYTSAATTLFPADADE